MTHSLQPPRASLVLGVLSGHLLALSCSSVEKPCVPGCVDETTRLECDKTGAPRAVECPTSPEACAAPLCQDGTCTFRPAVGAPCGPTGEAQCNEGFACIGPAVRLSAIREHTCAIADDGKVWCWGTNVFRELGDGTAETRPYAVLVSELPGRAIDVSTGYVHTCALLEDGSVYCWGNNWGGQTAPDLTTEYLSAPTLVPAPVGFVSIHAGQGHTCGVTTEKTVYCWGNTSAGQCGVEPLESNQVGPTQIPDLDHVESIETVKDHICAVRTQDPTLVCWGSNHYVQDGGYIVGKLGPAAAGRKYSPFPVPVDLGAKVIDVGMSYESTYAVTADGFVYGWGFNGSGQLGTGSTDKIVEKPGLVLTAPGQPLTGATDALRTDGSNQCASLRQGVSSSRYACWGIDDYGELGFGSAGFVSAFASPTSVIPESGTQVVRGENHGCFAAAEDGPMAIWCFGKEPFVANGKFEDRQVQPSPIVWNASPPSPVEPLPDE